MEEGCLSGVVYIHRLEDSLKSGALHRNMRVISHEFLGTDWFSRLTILVSTNWNPPNLNSTFRAISNPTSPFFGALEGGARLLHGIEEAQLCHVLESYASMTPALLRIQTGYGQIKSVFVGDSIERCLGYLDSSSVELHLKAQAENIGRAHRVELDEFRSALAESETRELDLSDRLDQMEVEISTFYDEEASLRHQLEQTQAEYASLRSQLQLQENIEQGDITRALKSLNREIESIGRSFSAFLVDVHAVRLLCRQSTDITTLHARHLPELKDFLGHKAGSPSLVASWQGRGLGIEDFFDYAIRSTLCRYLYKWVFCPFHPSVEGLESIDLGTMYNGIRRRGNFSPVWTKRL